MDNQQAKISDTEIAWLAGFFDGEGCFDYQRGYTKGLTETRWRPRVRVSNTHAPTLSVVDSLIQKMGGGHHIMWRHPSNPKYHPSWSVEIAGYKRVKRFLVQLSPWLQTKRKDAEVLLDFINSREESHPKDPYTPHEVELIVALQGRRH